MIARLLCSEGEIEQQLKVIFDGCNMSFNNQL